MTVKLKIIQGGPPPQPEQLETGPVNTRRSWLSGFVVGCLLALSGAIFTQQFAQIKSFLSGSPASGDTLEGNPEEKKRVRPLVTYYQWTDQHGNMRITRNKPLTTERYYSFQASANLRDYDYPIDPQLLARAEAYRDSLLRTDAGEAQAVDFPLVSISEILSGQTRDSTGDARCDWLQQWLTDISQPLQHVESMQTDFCDKYQKQLNQLSAMGCGNELRQFKRQLCQ